jgi:hypothetical protein
MPQARNEGVVQTYFPAQKRSEDGRNARRWVEAQDPAPATQVAPSRRMGGRRTGLTEQLILSRGAVTKRASDPPGRVVAKPSALQRQVADARGAP